MATPATPASADVLPFYDHYLWLFRGHVVGTLLFGATGLLPHVRPGRPEGRLRHPHPAQELTHPDATFPGHGA